MSYHQHCVNDPISGDIVDIVVFCSDACHKEWCANPLNDETYEGWSGCHECEHTEYCAQCGVVLPGYEDACDHQRDNVVVNRFRVSERELCPHGNIMQLAADELCNE